VAKEFIKQKIGFKDIMTARRQQDEIAYFTQSEVQQEITEEYIEQWATRNFRTNDKFLNWIKMLLRTDNFLTFYKYFRFPSPSAKIVNDKIKPQLARVFFAEDSHFKYVINGEEVENPEELDHKKFKKTLFNALLFRYNDIIIEDLQGINEPFRDIISIDRVVALDSHDGTIFRIAFRAHGDFIDENGTTNHINGFVYMDTQVFAFYDEEIKLIAGPFPHDLGKCPADYISSEPFSRDNDIVRKSIFTYAKYDMEEYVFLKTLQKMTEPNGAIPVVTMVKSKLVSNDDKDAGTSSDKEPMTVREISGYRSDEWLKSHNASQSVLQTGSIISVAPIKLEGGGLDMSAVTDYINFHHHPVEAMKYLDERIKELAKEIERSVTGELQDQTGERKNEEQVKAGFTLAQNKLRSFSLQISTINQASDWKMLALKFGPDNVMVETFYGTDFFLESQETLYDLFKISPNPIERKKILLRLSKKDNIFNKEKAEREAILYDLMPYVADQDFTTALEQFTVDWNTKQLQTRFNYWITLFEAEFGDIVVFWNGMDSSNSEKLIIINNLLLEIINQAVPEPQSDHEELEEVPQK